jgi:hypothetical protein
MHPTVALALAAQLVGVTAELLPVSEIAAAPQAGSAAEAQPPVRFDQTRFDTLTAFALQNLLDSVAAKGIPTGPLINRALEGAARRASGKVILQVVRAHAAALEQAREVLGANAPLDELEAGATALRAGVDMGTLRLVRAERPTGTALIALTVLTDIVQRGVPQSEARNAFTSIARMPGSDAMLNGLRETVAKNSGRGPGMAVDALNRYLRTTVKAAPPSSAPATTDRPPIRPPTPPP